MIEPAIDLLRKIFLDPFVQMATAPDLLVQTLWEGFVGGVLYALIALGYVLIYKASGVFNFAQGIMVVLAKKVDANLIEAILRLGTCRNSTSRVYRYEATACGQGPSPPSSRPRGLWVPPVASSFDTRQAEMSPATTIRS